MQKTQTFRKKVRGILLNFDNKRIKQMATDDSSMSIQIFNESIKQLLFAFEELVKRSKPKMETIRNQSPEATFDVGHIVGILDYEEAILEELKK